MLSSLPSFELDPNPSEHQIAEKERRFARIQIIFLIKDAYDLSEWYQTGEYHQRYYLQFGFIKNAPREIAWERCKERIQYFAQSRVFQTFCKTVGADAADTRKLIADLLEFRGDRERLRQLLQEYKEELGLYAKRGRQPKNKAS